MNRLLAVGRLLAPCLILLLACGAAVAQERTGEITGTVTDDSGAAVPGAAITATSPSHPGVLETTSDGQGRFRLFNVPVGTYTVTDRLTGFKTKTVLAVPLLDRLELVGVLELFNKRSGPFNERDLRLAEAACQAAATALRSIKTPVGGR